MSIQSILASAGLVESETEPEPTKTAPLATTPGAMLTLPATPSPPSGIDQGSLSKLMAEVNSAASPKYFQFQEMMGRMANIPGMSDAAKRQAAAAAVGITNEEITQAVDAMLKRLAQEETEYAAVVASAMQEQVVTKRTAVDSLRQQVASLEAEIAASATDIQAAAQTFKQTVDHARTQIEKMR